MNCRINKYLVIMGDEDDIVLNIKQDINRPNGPSDDEVIRNYMLNELGRYDYYTVDIDELDSLKTVEL